VELAYRTTIALGRTALRAIDLRVRLDDDRHVPRTGPAILVANHVSFLDFLLVGLAARPAGRFPRFLARHEVWRNPVAGPFMTAMRHVPVDRAVPAAAYLDARALLAAGEAVAVFPEAGISTSYTVRALMPGAAALAAETGAPLIPIALWGGQRIATAHRPVEVRRGRPVSIRVGAPYVVPPGTDPRGATRDLGAVLQGMLDELQRRPEHQPRPGEPAPWHPAHLGGGAPTPQAAQQVERTRHPHAVAPTWTPTRHSPGDTPREPLKK
jgi:1-acyl-sn-glycerol-3-phosphate acyltransferase